MWTKEKINEYIEICTKIHNGKYDYSQIKEIENAHTKIPIICPIHGLFYQRVDHHKNGHGCKECKKETLRTQKQMSIEEFINRSNEIHNNKYDYSKVHRFNNNSEKVIIICPIHGEFQQEVKIHLAGHGCQKCMADKLSELKRDTLENVVEQANKIHNNKYNYDMSIEYINRQTKLKIKCPEHGWFFQTANAHLRGQGCPICKESKLENSVRNLLQSSNINFESQKKFDWMGDLSLDFYIDSLKLGIECQGLQHFIPIQYFGGKTAFNRQIYNDNKKYELCQQHGIKIIYFTNFNIQNYNHELITDLENLLNKLK